MHRSLLFLLCICVTALSAQDLAPEISSQSAHQTVNYGSPATFWVEASAAPAPSFQWQRRQADTQAWVNIAGAIQASYSTGPTTAADDGDSYRCVVSNRAGTSTSFDRFIKVQAVFTSIPVTDAVVGQPYRYAFTTNVPAAAIAYTRARTVPDWLSLDTQTLSGTPDEVGRNSVAVEVRLLRPNGQLGTTTQHRLTIHVREAGNALPVIANATATPASVTGITTVLQASASDDGGEPALTYTWSAPDIPGSGFFLSFNPNSSNAAKTSTATFRRAGSFPLRLTVVDAGGAAATRDVTVVVAQTLSALEASLPAVSVVVGGSQVLAVTAKDQFNTIMQATGVTWRVVAGPGTVDAAGVYDAGAATAGQTATVRASLGAFSVDSVVSIIASSQAPSFISTPLTAIAPSASYRYTPTVSGVPPVQSITVSENLSWLRWNEEQGYLWGFAPASPGTYGPVTITASNGIGQDAVQTFNIIVMAPGDGRQIRLNPLPGSRWWEVDSPFTAAVPAAGSQVISGPLGTDVLIRPAGPAGNG